MLTIPAMKVTAKEIFFRLSYTVLHLLWYVYDACIFSNVTFSFRDSLWPPCISPQRLTNWYRVWNYIRSFTVRHIWNSYFGRFKLHMFHLCVKSSLSMVLYLISQLCFIIVAYAICCSSMGRCYGRVIIGYSPRRLQPAHLVSCIIRGGTANINFVHNNRA